MPVLKDKFEHQPLSRVMGSWPFSMSGKIGPVSGDYHVISRTLRDHASILSVRREPTAGFSLDGLSFYLWVDDSITGDPVQHQVQFAGGDPWSLFDVTTRINLDVGEEVAFNENGFLKLRSPRTGAESYLRVQTDPTSGTGVLHELGLFAEVISVGGEVVSASHVDSDRQVATPGQLSMLAGESFEANIFNRFAFQMALSSDRVFNLVGKKRLAVKHEEVVTYTSPGTGPKGLTLPGFVYTGPETFSDPPTTQELFDIIAILDDVGNEIVKVQEEVLGSPSVDPNTVVRLEDNGEIHVRDLSSAWEPVVDADAHNPIFIRLTGMAAPLDVFSNNSYKILRRLGDYWCVIEGVHPDTGVRMDSVLTTDVDVLGASSKVEVTKNRVRVTGFYDISGGSRVEKLERVKYEAPDPTTVTKVELGNRIFVSGAAFVTAGVVTGDVVLWSGHTQLSPYSNDGSYRVSQVIDQETLELCGSDFEPILLNPVQGTGFGDIEIHTDGQFWDQPFVEFDKDPAGEYVEPGNGDTIRVVYLKMSSFLDAAQDPAFLAGPSVRYTQEASEDLQKAVMNIWGPSVRSFQDALYPNDELTNMSLERLDYRLNKEHYYDTGRHSEIFADQVNVGPPDYGTPARQIRLNNHGLLEVSRFTDGFSTHETFARLSAYTNNELGIRGPAIEFLTSRGGWSVDSLPVMTPTINGTVLGSLHFSGVGTSNDFSVGAWIQAVQDGAAGPNLVPTRLVFRTSDGTANPVEWFRLTSSGRVGIGTIDPQSKLHVSDTGELLVDFSSTGLDDSTVRIGRWMSNSKDAQLYFFSDPSNTPYGLALARIAGANGIGYLHQRGTGQLQVGTEQAANLVFLTTYIERMRIWANGHKTISSPVKITNGALSTAIDSAIHFDVGTIANNTDPSSPYMSLSRIRTGTGSYQRRLVSHIDGSGNSIITNVDFYESLGSTGGAQLILAGATGVSLRHGSADDGFVGFQVARVSGATCTIDFRPIGAITSKAIRVDSSGLWPRTNNDINLGASGNRWNNIYGKIIHPGTGTGEGIGTHLYPTGTTFTLGGATRLWKDAYIKERLYIGNTNQFKLEVSGGTGNPTIVFATGQTLEFNVTYSRLSILTSLLRLPTRTTNPASSVAGDCYFQAHGTGFSYKLRAFAGNGKLDRYIPLSSFNDASASLAGTGKITGSTSYIVSPNALNTIGNCIRFQMFGKYNAGTGGSSVNLGLRVENAGFTGNILSSNIGLTTGWSQWIMTGSIYTLTPTVIWVYFQISKADDAAAAATVYTVNQSITTLDHSDLTNLYLYHAFVTGAATTIFVNVAMWDHL